MHGRIDSGSGNADLDCRLADNSRPRPHAKQRHIKTDLMADSRVSDQTGLLGEFFNGAQKIWRYPDRSDFSGTKPTAAVLRRARWRRP